MGGLPFWGNAAHVGSNFAEDPWDVVFIGGDPLPGICEVKGIAQLEVDKKKAKGTNGSTITVSGYQPGPFEVSVTVWTSDQWDFLQAWIDKFWIEQQAVRPSKTTVPPVAFDIDHPGCALLGIRTCVIEGISMPEAGSSEGTKVVRIKLYDGRVNEKKTVTKTAKGSRVNVEQVRSQQGLNDVPEKPSAERADLGPTGPRAKPASGSD
jgi:hypothetical protein